MLDIKLRYIGPPGKPPTRETVIEALEHMLATGGEVPPYFQFAAIDWTRPGKASHGFRAGSVGNFAQFAPIIRAKLHGMKMALNRKPSPPSGEQD